MTVSYCGHCGESSAGDESFCVACGHRLRRPEVQSGGDVSTADNESLPLRQALKLLAAGEPAAAADLLKVLVEAEPAWAVARAYLGLAHLQMASVAEARTELEEAVRLAPGSFICRTKYAEFLARLGFYDTAVVQLDAALQFAAPDAESLHAARELRAFCRDKAKGLFYRQTASPLAFRFRNLLPRSQRRGGLSLERGS
jgi:Tfp pilus assembly protein PilF